MTIEGFLCKQHMSDSNKGNRDISLLYRQYV